MSSLYLQAAESDDDGRERLLQMLEESDSELHKLYDALVAAGQRDVVNLLRDNEQLLSSSFTA